MTKDQFFHKIFKDCFVIDSGYETSTFSIKFIPVIFNSRLQLWIKDSSRYEICVNPFFFKGTIVGFLGKNKDEIISFISRRNKLITYIGDVNYLNDLN